MINYSKWLKNYLNDNHRLYAEERKKMFWAELFEKKNTRTVYTNVEYAHPYLCMCESVCVCDVLLCSVYDGRIQGRRKPRKDEFSQ